MTTSFFILTVLFIIISVAMVLIILVQRSQGGGLAGAFGGAGGGSTDTVFGGRVGDALTWATVSGFALYLLCAVVLNKVESSPNASVAQSPGVTSTGGDTPGDVPTTPADPAADDAGGTAPFTGAPLDPRADPADAGDAGSTEGGDPPPATNAPEGAPDGEDG